METMFVIWGTTQSFRGDEKTKSLLKFHIHRGREKEVELMILAGRIMLKLGRTDVRETLRSTRNILSNMGRQVGYVCIMNY